MYGINDCSSKGNQGDENCKEDNFKYLFGLYSINLVVPIRMVVPYLGGYGDTK